MRLDAALRWVECQSLNQLKIEDRTNHESPTIISVRIYANKESASVSRYCQGYCNASMV